VNYNLFSVGIYKTKLNLDVDIIIKYLKNLKKKDKGRNISNPKGMGWQSNDLNLGDFIELQEQIKPHLLDYMNTVSLAGTAKLTSMWANINSYKDYNEAHTHAAAQISFVYYLQTPENCGEIFFENPFKNIDILWANCKKTYTPYTASQVIMGAEENNLFIFPGCLFHGVKPNLNKKEDRISISSNILIQ
tara:strand:+ start:2754 stop:3323 length:570 start_codon:yes stop_codon:yes gene_type:complete